MEIKVRTWLWIVLAAVIVLGGGFTYWYVKESKSTVSLKTSPTPTKSIPIKPLTPSGAITNSPSVLSPTPTHTPTPSPTALQTPDETAGWETFVNGTYGYSIKYPADWKIDAAQMNNVQFTGKATAHLADRDEDQPFSFNFGGFDYSGSLDQYLKDLKTSYDQAPKIQGWVFGTQTTITLGGEPGFKISGLQTGTNSNYHPFIYDWYFVKHDSKIYNSAVTTKDMDSTFIDFTTFDSTASKILSTLHFTQ